VSQPWYAPLAAGAPIAAASFGALAGRTCPLCGGARGRAVLAGQYYAQASLDVMAVVECAGCGFLFTDPIPTAGWFDKYLDRRTNPWWGDDGGWMTLHWQQEHEREKFEDGLAIVRRLRGAGSLLDVGCGPGLFVQMARAAGIDAVGVDVFAKVVPEGDDHLTCLPVASLPPASVDIVTLWCVVAHEPDVRGLLRECRRVLRRGGLILVETPNMTLWRWLRPLRTMYERLSPRAGAHDQLGAYAHINHFTASTLTTVLTASGFDDVQFHLIRNYEAERGWLDRGKRLLFTATGSRVNVCYPLVATATAP
jgi:SAM-dependent methyltransferase